MNNLSRKVGVILTALSILSMSLPSVVSAEGRPGVLNQMIFRGEKGYTPPKKDGARRQNVIERTAQYSKGVDLIDIRNKNSKNFRGNAGKGVSEYELEQKQKRLAQEASAKNGNNTTNDGTVFGTSALAESSATSADSSNSNTTNTTESGDTSVTAQTTTSTGNCGGKTSVTCTSNGKTYNFPCCGEKECSTMVKNDGTCKVNLSSGHGNKDSCLDPVQTSPCGMSCCGAADCAVVCQNYRMDVCQGYTQANGVECCGLDDCKKAACGYFTETTDNMGGIAGIPCCGFQDCREKACEGQMVVDSKVDPTQKNLLCCGAYTCHLAECQEEIVTDNRYGGDSIEGLECCGIEDCHLKACSGQIDITSVSNQQVTCCGPNDCEIARCDRQTSILTPHGVEACCGAVDCRYKQCEGKIQVRLYNGQVVQCCGSECDSIAAKDAISSNSVANSVFLVEAAALFYDSGKIDDYHRMRYYNKATMIFVSNEYTDRLFQYAGLKKEKMSCLGTQGNGYGYRVPIGYVKTNDYYNPWGNDINAKPTDLIPYEPEIVWEYRNPIIYIDGKPIEVRTYYRGWEWGTGNPGVFYGIKHPSRCSKM